jgi:hypothetical protein
MALNRTHLTAIVIFVVIAVVGSGLLTGGAVTTDVDFSIRSVSMPEKILAGETVRPVATFENTGSISAGSVSWRLLVLTSGGGLAVSKDGRVYLPAHGMATADLGPWDLSRGSYTTYLWVDYQQEHTERDESNNLYTAAFSVV